MSLAAITKLLDVIERVRNEAPALPTQQLHVFLAVALNEGNSQVSIQQHCKMTNAAGSRNIRALKEFADEDRPGLNWIYSEQNPEHHREQLLYLTREGRRVLKTILKPLELE
jgi:DNA-binding MarR family transcriptional regulator